MKLWQRFFLLALVLLLLIWMFLNVAVSHSSSGTFHRKHQIVTEMNEFVPSDIVTVTAEQIHPPNIVQHSLECIEKNICKNRTINGRAIYRYVRHFEFYVNLSRTINYNVNVTNNMRVVPRIVHFTWVKGHDNHFKFVHLLSLLAAQRFTTPDRIYFWYDILPVGRYWEEALKVINNMFLVFRERMMHIRGHPLLLPVHVSDVMRLEALLEFGGMFFDLDSIVVNNVDPLLKYDATMGHAAWYILANGIMFSKPWSDFMRVWYETYSQFKQDFQTNSNIIPNIISLRVPNLLHIENTSLCRPNYDERAYLFDEGVFWDWKRKNYVVHLYMRAYEAEGYPELSPSNIQYMNTTIGEIARYIYNVKEK